MAGIGKEQRADPQFDAGKSYGKKLLEEWRKDEGHALDLDDVCTNLQEMNNEDVATPEFLQGLLQELMASMSLEDIIVGGEKQLNSNLKEEPELANVMKKLKLPFVPAESLSKDDQAKFRLFAMTLMLDNAAVDSPEIKKSLVQKLFPNPNQAPSIGGLFPSREAVPSLSNLMQVIVGEFGNTVLEDSANASPDKLPCEELKDMFANEKLEQLKIDNREKNENDADAEGINTPDPFPIIPKPPGADTK